MKFILRNKMNILFIVIFIAAGTLSIFWGYVKYTKETLSFNFNILTVNSIFLGFLFTSLGIMTGFTEKRIVKALDVGGYMDNYYNSIYFGMFCLTISTTISLIIILFVDYKSVSYLWIVIQKISLLGGVIFFVKSIFGVMRIIHVIRNENDN